MAPRTEVAWATPLGARSHEPDRLQSTPVAARMTAAPSRAGRGRRWRPVKGIKPPNVGRVGASVRWVRQQECRNSIRHSTGQPVPHAYLRHHRRDPLVGSSRASSCTMSWRGTGPARWLIVNGSSAVTVRCLIAHNWMRILNSRQDASDQQA